MGILIYNINHYNYTRHAQLSSVLIVSNNIILGTIIWGLLRNKLFSGILLPTEVDHAKKNSRLLHMHFLGKFQLKPQSIKIMVIFEYIVKYFFVDINSEQRTCIEYKSVEYFS